ncbi:MAG: diguanylate cyclase [Desulfobulbaceae bacterium]|nr:diguanylate cyclase [Desulfobulbaceae bacterium]
MRVGRSLDFLKQIFISDEPADQCGRLCSLRVRILGWTLLLFGLALGVTLIGMWNYHHERLLEMTQLEATQAGLTIEAGLRASMLKNDRQAIQSTIDEMIRVTKLSRIHILDGDGRVAMSSDATMPGKSFDRDSDQACISCHQTRGVKPQRSAMLIEDAEGPYWRNVIKVENRPACYGCHPPEQKVCGVLVIDASMAEMYSILRDATKRLLLTGILTFLLIAVVVSHVVNRFVLDPLRVLRAGFGKVGRGEFDHWVDIKGCGELAEMGESFNIMSRAIGRYMKEVGRKTQEFEMLYAIVQKMSETIELKRVMEIVVNILHDVVRAKCVLLAVANEHDKNRFELTWRMNSDRRCFWADYCIHDEELPHASICREDLLGWQTGEMLVPQFTDEDQRAMLPLAMKDMRFGMVCIVKEPGHRFSHADKNLFPSLAQHIAISLANARLYNQAITDELTSLYTKRHFYVKAKELSEDFGRTFCLMILDLDHFKKVNDTHGHPVGDLVLAGIGELIWLSIRRGDIPCRYGGEEFAILLPDVELDEARRIADRLLNYIADFNFVVDEEHSLRMTTSIGLAAYPRHAATVDELVAAADGALYEAKRNGRNQVRVFGVAEV